MINPPSRNLPTPAEPWGRSVDSRLVELEREQLTQSEFTMNALSSINGTLTRLGEQVTEIQTITRVLTEQQTTLTAQQAALTSQQEQLASTVGQLTELVNGQISAQTKTSSQYASYTGDLQDFASVSFTFPAGYSRAYVMCVSSASFDTSAGTNAAIYTRIHEYASGQQASQSANGDVISITSSFAALVQGVTSFSCATRAQDVSGVISQGWVQTSATVLFLR